DDIGLLMVPAGIERSVVSLGRSGVHLSACPRPAGNPNQTSSICPRPMTRSAALRPVFTCTQRVKTHWGRQDIGVSGWISPDAQRPPHSPAVYGSNSSAYALDQALTTRRRRLVMCLAVELVGEPGVGNPHVRFENGGAASAQLDHSPNTYKTVALR